jgi:signal transduction histidine kinase/HD-like signal output (HDOD) protein
LVGKSSHERVATSTPASPAENLRNIELILGTIDQLPTLSAVAVQVLQWGSAGEVDIDAGAQLIETDPALAAPILALCTRADKGMVARVTTVKHAVVMLGVETVRSAALSVAVFDLLRGAQRKAKANARSDEQAENEETTNGQAGDRGFDKEAYWRFCVGVGSACEALARANKTGKQVPSGQAFLAGLLSGLGRIALAWALPSAYDRVVQLARLRGVATSVIERELLGIDHHAAARRLAQRWGLPAAMTDCMWLHDAPPEALAGSAEHAHLVTLVTSGKAIARVLSLGDGCDANEHMSLQQAVLAVGLTQLPGAQIDAIADQTLQLCEHRVKVLGIKTRTTQQELAQGLARATQRLSETASVHARAAAVSSQQAAGVHLATMLAQAAKEQWTLDVAASTLIRALCGPSQSVQTSAACAVLCGVRGSWRVWQSGAEREQQGRVLDLPGTATTALEGLFLPGVAMPTLGVFQWLADELAQLPDVRLLQAHPAARDEETGLRVLVIASEATLAPLVAAADVAGALFVQAARSDEARELQEKFVAMQRDLAASQAAATQAQSMAKLGATTAGAAHEMNTPLAVIVGRAQLLLARLQNERDKAAVQAIAGSARQISDLISSLHVLSTPPTPALAPTALRDAMDQSIIAAQCRLCSDVAVRIEMTEGMYALTDGALITRVLTELVTNALEACPNGPVIIHGAMAHDLLIEVRDEGRGLSNAALAHAFDPFFSERPAGRGKGLGLSRARAIVQAMGGSIRLVSAQSMGQVRGAVALVRIPMQKLEKPALLRNGVR